MGRGCAATAGRPAPEPQPTREALPPAADEHLGHVVQPQRPWPTSSQRPHFVSQLAEEIPYYEQRHLIAPGLTGWAQIKYPYGSSIEDARQKLQYDLYYIKNQSLALDAAILFETIKTILFGRGAR